MILLFLKIYWSSLRPIKASWESLSGSWSIPQYSQNSLHTLWFCIWCTPSFHQMGQKIECVDDFKYLGGYTDTEHEISVRITLAWSTLYLLQRNKERSNKDQSIQGLHWIHPVEVQCPEPQVSSVRSVLMAHKQKCSEWTKTYHGKVVQLMRRSNWSGSDG